MSDRTSGRPASPAADRAAGQAAENAAKLAARKTELRSELRARRRTLPAPLQHDAALGVADVIRALPAWDDARHVALYLAADGEIDTAPIAGAARSAQKHLYLPVVAGQSLEFAVWEDGAALVPNRFAIPEPSPDAPRRAASELDIIFMPVVGWDTDGGRLGMGAGFYDRALAQAAGPLLVGLAHACQQVPRIPRETWDIRMDFVATAAALHDCRDWNSG